MRRSLASPSLRRSLAGPGLRYAAGPAAVAAATVLGLALGADPETASLLLLGAVLLAALQGRRAGLLAALGGSVALLYVFAPPGRRSAWPRSEDLPTLAAFLGVAAVVGTVAARTYRLRVRAEARRREAEVRSDLTARLLAGEAPESLASRAADALVGLFKLASCTVAVGGTRATATSGRRPHHPLRVARGSVAVEAVAAAGRPPSTEDRAVLEALAAALATAVDNVSLEREASRARVAAAVGRVRSGFLSLVSHNLRTPLAAIKASVETLEDPEVRLAPAERAELRATIHAEADRLERLVTKVLDLSRIRSGASDLDRQPADLAELAGAALRRLLPIAGDRELRAVVPPGLPEVRVDVMMLEQVFLNLLENALRYAPPATAIVLSARAADAAFVEVRVVDRGPGVAPEERERVFEEFYRAEGSRDSAGTGLGLAIVRAVVVAHGGEVWCEETPGGGATFALRLPTVGGA